MRARWRRRTQSRCVSSLWLIGSPAWEQAVDGVLDVSTPWIVLTGDGEFADLEGDGMFGLTPLEAGDVDSGQFAVFQGDATL